MCGRTAWTGFQKRPLLGWGFGADFRYTQAMESRIESLGTISRDAVNDTLFVLEGSGVVGLWCLRFTRCFCIETDSHTEGATFTGPDSLAASRISGDLILQATIFTP